MNIAQNLERAAHHFRDKPAIVFEHQVLTYGDLRAAVDRAAFGLCAMGVGVGEVARAVVVLQPDSDLTSEALEAYCRGHLATYKAPRQFEFAAELPKSATGKILKRVLRDQTRRADSNS